jgi:hypothetical protein
MGVVVVIVIFVLIVLTVVILFKMVIVVGLLMEHLMLPWPGILAGPLMIFSLCG